MREVRRVAIGPPARDVVREHEADAQASRRTGESRGRFLHGESRSFLRPRREPGVHRGQHVLLGHRVHRDERQLDIVAAAGHGREVLAEPLHPARQRVDLAVMMKQRQMLELHVGSPNAEGAGPCGPAPSHEKALRKRSVAFGDSA